MIRGLVEINSPISCDVSLETGKRKYTYRDTQVDIIQKDLEVLDIISEKRVQVGGLLYCSCLEGYNKGREITYQLTEEEYDLLKEVLL